MIVFGIVGLLLISYGLWVKNERHQDVVFIFGGIALLAYSIYIQDIIFIVLQAVFLVSAAIELIKLSRRR
jgi:lipid-A-disaccharide synthase-like uncharacterized protein